VVQYRRTKALTRDQLWTTPALQSQGLKNPWILLTVVEDGLPLTSLAGNAGVCLNHSQQGIPQLSNSQTGPSAEILTLLGAGRPKWPGHTSAFAFDCCN